MERSPLTSIFTRFRDNLRRLAAEITGNRDEAEDAVHDAFCKLWANHREIRSETEAMKLSYTAVKRTAIDVVRVRNSHPAVWNEDVPESGTESAEDADRMELYNAVLSLSRRVLKDKYYQIFMMHDVDGMAYPEIAESLGLSQENVRAYLSRARKMIREVYRNNYKM